MTGTYTPLGLKSKTFNHVHVHHHLGQNRPHQKTITHPHGPPQPPEPDEVLLCGGEGLIRSPLPCLYCKTIVAEEEIFFSCQEPNQSAKKIKKYG